MSEPSRVEQPAEPKVSWLLNLRWVAVVGQLVTILFVRFVLGVEVPLGLLLGIVAVAALVNVGVVLWLRIAASAAAEPVVGSIMVLDMALLTGLLYVSGGAANPFCLFYLVNVVLAAQVLGARWGWVLGILACGCWGFLLAFHVSLPAIEPLVATTLGAARAAGKLRMSGMLVAFVTATVIVLYFFARLTNEIGQLEAALLSSRKRRERGERLEAMATLAAGAAHELSSPLSTIAVAAKELERGLAQSSDLKLAIEDTRLIRSEVDRCRRILDQMSADAGERAGEPLAPLAVETLVTAVLEGLDVQRIRTRVEPGVAQIELTAPRHALAQALRGLVKNALDASDEDQAVIVHVSQVGPVVLLTIQDEGSGMDAETLDRAGHPFFTTKEPGSGMGLGLFLARAVVEQVGGGMELRSVQGQGTTVCVRLPLAPYDEKANA